MTTKTEPEIVSINPDELPSAAAYRLLVSCVVPRPIAWVSTISSEGVLNLAPYSFFNAVSGSPLTVMFSVSSRRGRPKDTLINARQTGEFVLNVVDETLAEAMNQTSAEWDYEVDEFERAGLESIPSTVVRPPRVALARVALEAKVSQILPLEGTDSTLVFGQVVCFQLQAGLRRDNGLVDANLLRPLTRLGGEEYATFGEVFTMARPPRPE